MRIGMLLTDGLGDLVCATGMIADVRRAHPDAFLCVVGRSQTEAAILSGPTRVDAFIKFAPATDGTPSGLLRLIGQLRRQKLDVFIVATDIDRNKAPMLALATGAAVRVGEYASPAGRLYTHHARRDASKHKVISNADILKSWGIPAGSAPVIQIAPQEQQLARRLLSERGIDDNAITIAVHAGTGGALSHKQWSATNYAQLLDQLGRLGARAVLLGGPAEKPVYEEMLGAMRLPAAAVSLVAETDIRMTAAIISISSAAFGGDTGVMHVAAAVGTPTIVMFGPTDERRTGPFAATQVLTATLSCRPCYETLPYGCGRPTCMSGIQVQQALDAISRVVFARPQLQVLG